MGSDPDVYKMENRNLGKNIGDREDTKKDVNVQEIGVDPQGGGDLGTNFDHQEKVRHRNNNRDDQRKE